MACDDEVSVLLNQGNGTFATAVNYAVGAWTISLAAADLEVADLNGHGRVDVVVARDNAVSVRLNTCIP